MNIFSHPLLKLLTLAGIVLVMQPYGTASDQHSIAYHYQTLIAGLIAAFAALKTIQHMQKQLDAQDQQLTNKRIAQLAVFKQATRLYMNKLHNAAHNSVLRDYTSMGIPEGTVAQAIWKDLHDSPPHIFQDYNFIANLPSDDIATCLNICYEAELLHKMVTELQIQSSDEGNGFVRYPMKDVYKMRAALDGGFKIINRYLDKLQ